MALKCVVLVSLVAFASAGVIPSAPLAYHAAAAPVAYQAAAPVAYQAAAPVAYQAAPVAYQAAPLAYAAAPVAKVAAPVAYSSPVAYAAPVAKVAVEEYDHHPQYSFAYDVQDGLTGDSKTQHETRNGDVVQGSYSVVDPDGTKRTVEYTADDHNGFNAVVHKEPLAVKVATVAKVAAPVAYAAPVAKFVAPVAAKIAAPVSYVSAPVAKIAAGPVAYSAPFSYSAPVYHH